MHHLKAQMDVLRKVSNVVIKVLGLSSKESASGLDDPVELVSPQIPFDTPLVGHQVIGVEDIHEMAEQSEKRMINICDKMGFGKTYEAIGFIFYCLLIPVTRSARFIILQPKHHEIWEEAITALDPHPRIERIESCQQFLCFLKVPYTPHTWFMISRNLLDIMYRTDHYRRFRQYVYDNAAVIIYDESHSGTYTGALRSQITQSMNTACGGWVINVTGTPIRSDPEKELRKTFKTMNIPWPNNVSAAIEIMRSMTLMRPTELLIEQGALPVPELIQEIVYVDPPSGKQMQIKTQPKKRTRPNKKKQPAQLDYYNKEKLKAFMREKIPKIDFMISIYQSLSSGEKMIVGVEHLLVQSILVQYLTSKGIDDFEVYRNQTPTKTILITINSRGVGKNWQEYNHVLVMQCPSSPHTVQQLLYRAVRQRSPHQYVYVYYILTRGFVSEEKMFARIKARQHIINKVHRELSNAHA